MVCHTDIVFLGLGSNVGDKKANLQEALRHLVEAGQRVIQSSSLYQTEPVDFIRQDWFLNLVIRLETGLSPLALLALCQEIETALGRDRALPKGPRTIDLDILFYGDSIISEPGLQIPHPRLHLRRFVLVPLSEMTPDWVHPGLGQSVADLLIQCPDQAQVVPWVESLGPIAYNGKSE
jgi:2-amino-4-hydroxy-6-hydroxymethyldihydropteridine diphosphokinase